MAGRRELGFLKTSGCSLKEQVARKTLRNVRLQGHTYVDLRKDGKREVFFCTLCLAPCYGDSVLFKHLNGNLHTERLAVARATLLKTNPWPFNDGMIFFNDLSEQVMSSPVQHSDQIPLLDTDSNVENPLAIVSWQKTSGSDENNLHIVRNVGVLDEDPDVKHLNDDRAGYHLVIPGVLWKDEISDLEVRHMGIAQIAARFTEKDGVLDEIHRIWCEWLGRKNGVNSLMVLEHDFAVVTFSYNYNLGRKGLLDEIKYLLPSSPHSESEDNNGSRNRKRKSFSDPEDVSEFLSNQYDSSGEESLSSNSSNTRMLLDGYDDQLLHARVLNSKTLRRELRRQQSLAAERMCDICQQKMLPGKDVAALLNRKTGRLACSSRNLTGAFHVFHVSCLIHWILLCELEIYPKQLDAPKVKRRSRKKAGAKQNKKGKMKNDELTGKTQICSAFCPECQGTGINIEGDELEKPTVPLSEIFKYKIKSNDARKAWFKSPEPLENCSIGFYFPPKSENPSQEKVSPLKLLHFYRANESRPCTTSDCSLF